jgi:hypothetical protein
LLALILGTRRTRFASFRFARGALISGCWPAFLRTTPRQLRASVWVFGGSVGVGVGPLELLFKCEERRAVTQTTCTTGLAVHYNITYIYLHWPRLNIQTDRYGCADRRVPDPPPHRRTDATASGDRLGRSAASGGASIRPTSNSTCQGRWEWVYMNEHSVGSRTRRESWIQYRTLGTGST